MGSTVKSVERFTITNVLKFTDFFTGRWHTARSIIIDCVNNWGDPDIMGLRQIDFWYKGSKLLLEPVDFVCWGDGLIEQAFDVTTNKVTEFATNDSDHRWSIWATSNVRISCVFNSTISFDGIRVTNFHIDGFGTDRGVRDAVIHTSTDVITDTTYNAPIPNSETIFDGQFDEHVPYNVEDEQRVPLVDVISIGHFTNISLLKSQRANPVLRIGSFVNTSYLHGRISSPPSIFTAKSVVLELKDTHEPNGTFFRLRQVDFLYDGVKLPFTPSDFITYVSSEENDSFKAENAFDTSLSKTGAQLTNEWSSFNFIDLQPHRLICVFDLLQTFDEIRVTNHHHSGTETSFGVKNVIIHTSTNTITDTVYNSFIPNSETIFYGQFDEHIQDDISDEQLLETAFYSPYITSTVLPISLHSFTTINSLCGWAWTDEGTWPLSKSVVFDIDTTEDWGNSAWVGLRSIDFLYDGVKLPLTPSDFIIYKSSLYSEEYKPENIFDTSLSKTGSIDNTSWLCDVNEKNERIIVVFNTPIIFDEISVNNYHSSGESTDKGLKHVFIRASTDEIVNPEYNAPVSNSTFLFNGQIREHVDADVEDEQILGISTGPLTDLAFFTTESFFNAEAVPPIELSIGSFTTTDNLNGKLTVADFSFGEPVKSIMIDPVSNWWGDPMDVVKLCQIDFWYKGAKIVLTPSDFTCYGNTDQTSGGDYSVENIFDTSTIKVGYDSANYWSDEQNRLICVFDTPIIFDEIRVTNYHYRGYSTHKGVKDAVITVSRDEITDTVYGSGITTSNFMVIFDGQFREHIDQNVLDEQILMLNVDRTISAVHFSSYNQLKGLHGDYDIISVDSFQNINLLVLDYIVSHPLLIGYFQDVNILNGRFFNFDAPHEECSGYYSIIIDCVNNWGDSDTMGLRQIDFWYRNSKIEISSDDITCYPVHDDNKFLVENIFDTSTDKSGFPEYNGWEVDVTENKRIICIFDSPFTFDEIRVNNYHWGGYHPDRGVKNAIIHISTGAITDTTYNAPIPNSVKVFDGQFDAHEEYYDGADAQSLDASLGVVFSGVHFYSTGKIYGWDGNTTKFLDHLSVVNTLNGLPEYNEITVGYFQINCFLFGEDPYVFSAEQIHFPNHFQTNNLLLYSPSAISGPLVFIEEFYGFRINAIFNEFYADVLFTLQKFDEHYGNTYNTIQNIEEPYEDVSNPSIFFMEPYEDVSNPSIFFMEPYKDASVSIQSFIEPYKDVKMLSKQFIELYGKTASVTALFIEEYLSMFVSTNMFTQPYSITQEIAQNSFVFEYDLMVNNKSLNQFNLPWSLLSEVISFESPVVSVVIDSKAIQFASIALDASIDQYCITCAVSVLTEDDYTNSPHLADATVTLNGEIFSFFVDSKQKQYSNEGVTYSLSLVSDSVKLDSPYSETIVQAFPNGIYAKALVEDMASKKGILVDYQILDWFLPGYAININGETPLEVIKKVANAVGGVVQSKPNGSLLIIDRYTVSPTEWDVGSPFTVFSVEDEVIDVDESLKINSGYNAYIVSEGGGSSIGITLQVEDQNDPTEKIIKGFRVPFSDGEFELLTSGGSVVSLDKYMYPVEETIPSDSSEEWEIVEFIDWSGETQHPIYEILDYEWIEVDLGSFDYTENGVLTIQDTSSVPSESLLRIKYKTKYWKWTAVCTEPRNVQFYVPEIVDEI